MTKKEEKEKRVKDILDAAVTEFVEQGYENTSMESIAARAGLTKGGLYYHFSSKDDILIRANDRFMEPVMGIMTQAMEATTASEALTLYIQKYLAYWSMHPMELAFVFLSMTKAVSDVKLRTQYRGYTAQMKGFFKGLYGKGIDTGEFREMDDDRVSLALMAVLDSLTGYLVIDSELSLDLAVESCVYSFITVYGKERRGE